jgi:hypothetical protein
MTHALGLSRLFLLPLLWTIAIEVCVAALWGLRTRQALLGVVGLNLVTNPTLNLVLGLFPLVALASPTYGLVALLEVAVVLVEWRLLQAMFGQRRSGMLRLSLCMNATSLALGLVLHWASLI